MSFVEKALKRLKQQESVTPLGRLHDPRTRPPAPEHAQEAAHEAAHGPAAAPAPHARAEVPVDGALATPASPASPDESHHHVRKIVIDRDRLRAEGFLAPDEYERRMADEYRRVKRPIIAHAFGIDATPIEKGNLILVSSAVSGEGKTHTCINLALSLATERDRTVLLIDGDVAKPHISRLFGIQGEPGLLDVLGDTPPALEDVLVRTDIPRLSVMPAGQWHDQATELLASERMRRMCDELASRYPDRIILFDSPPMLAAPEAQAIGAAVGQVVLIIAANMTAREDVRAALALIDESKAVNAILNKSRVSGGSSYYGGYGHGYGYGSSGAPATQ